MDSEAVTQLKEQVAGLKEQVAGLKEQVAWQKEQIAGLEEEVDWQVGQVAELKEKLRLANLYHPDGRCRSCSGMRDGLTLGHHDMYCAQYVGPVTHAWHRVKENATFGGLRYRCSCGALARIGGMAGINPLSDGAAPVCPNEAETWRGPRPAEAGEVSTLPD